MNQLFICLCFAKLIDDFGIFYINCNLKYFELQMFCTVRDYNDRSCWFKLLTLFLIMFQKVQKVVKTLTSKYFWGISIQGNTFVEYFQVGKNHKVFAKRGGRSYPLLLQSKKTVHIGFNPLRCQPTLYWLLFIYRWWKNKLNNIYFTHVANILQQCSPI